MLVANDVPAPDAIDDSWLVAARLDPAARILDDSFRPALDYLTKSFVGAEVNIAILESNARPRRRWSRRSASRCVLRWASSSADERDVLYAVQNLGP